MVSVEALEALFVANPDFEKIERSRNVFCPFEAAGMVRQEIRHGHFLAYCLDPQRPHGLGSECLRALMRSAAYAQRLLHVDPTEGHITPLDVHLMDFEKAQIRREWRNIDLLAIVNDEKRVIAIELKINSKEHSGQLRKYRETVSKQWPIERGWRHLFLYLTKHGDEASDSDGEGWLALHLDAVAREFDSVVMKQMGTPDAHRLLAAYLAMLRRHHLTDEDLEELAGKLWSQHREALEFLMERRPDVGEGVFGQIYQLREEIASRMAAASGADIITDDCSPSIVRFAVRNWDDLPEFLTAQRWTSSNRLMLIEFERGGDKQHLRMRFVLGPGEQNTRLSYHRALVDAGVPNTNKKKITPQWTRLGTRSVRIPEDEEIDDTVDIDEEVLQEIEGYAKEMIPAYGDALSALRAPRHGNAALVNDDEKNR